jgi:hypothetical protein
MFLESDLMLCLSGFDVVSADPPPLGWQTELNLADGLTELNFAELS